MSTAITRIKVGIPTPNPTPSVTLLFLLLLSGVVDTVTTGNCVVQAVVIVLNTPSDPVIWYI